MRSAVAYAPGHVTGFFHISDSASDPLRKGSLGAGFSIAAGVTTRVGIVPSPADGPTSTAGGAAYEQRIVINGSVRPDAVVSETVVRLFFERLAKTVGSARRVPSPESMVQVEHRVEVPEASGFGSSGAAALSLALALNALFDTPLSAVACGQLAHLAEVSCGTGLGTVIGEYEGGCEIRVVPGAPGIGRVETFAPGEQQTVLFVVYGPLPTKSLLADEEVRAGINAAGSRYLEQLRDAPTMASFLRLSRRFAEGSGLISDRVRELLEAFDAVSLPASMLMFGEGVFAVAPREQVPHVRALVDKLKQNGDLLVSTIESRGGRIVHAD